MFFLNLNIAGCDKKIPNHCLLLFCKITTRVVTNQIHHAYAFYIYIYIFNVRGNMLLKHIRAGNFQMFTTKLLLKFLYGS